LLRRRRSFNRAASLLALGAALSGLAGCASDRREPSGEVIRTDEIARREREGYDLARQAAAAERAGNPDRAIELYSQAVGVWPEIPSAWNNLGLLLMDQSNYMEAVEAFKTAARQNVSDPRPLINVGVAYDRTGWAEEALAAYLQALERSPTDRDALLGAITANHRLLGGDRPSLERVKTALLIEPDPAVREWLERERFRIEARLAAVAADAPVIPTPVRPAPSAPVQIPPTGPATGP
jgi:tetratricopeptide (TPR) repeat protein